MWMMLLVLVVATLDEPRSTAEAVAVFAERWMGRQVGGGECAELARDSLQAADAKPRAADHPDRRDYVWGELILLIEGGTPGPRLSRPDDQPPRLSAIARGDILQFRDARFEIGSPRRPTVVEMPHHTAIVRRVRDEGRTLEILHQNFAGRREVTAFTLQPPTLRAGWVRVYRPLPRDGEEPR